mgnify:CR=1 FL=1
MFRPSRSYIQALVVGFSFCSFLGCNNQAPDSEKAMRSFIEAYYVRADLVAAKRISTGLALENINRQIRLRKNFEKDRSLEQISPGVGKNRNVETEILEVRDRSNGDKVYRSSLSILNSTVAMELQVLITVGKRGRSSKHPWVVVNFAEIRNLSSEKSQK